jgi:hypothetical protein
LPLLRIERASAYGDARRSYKIVLNGIVVGKVKQKEIKEIPITSGPHNLVFKIDWCGSEEIHFSAEEGQIIEFVVRKSDATGALGGMFSSPNTWISVKRKSESC